MTAALVAIRGLTKTYPGTVAVKDADLDLREGEVLGLLGKNGAGKTTLIKMLAGAVRPDSGEILLEGRPLLPAFDARMARRLGLSFVFQELEIVPQLSVAENVLLGSHYPRGTGQLVSWRRVNQAASEVLRDLGLDIDPRSPAGSLSSAMQRMVVIARALFAQPRLLVLDEPTASLADSEISVLFGIIGKLRDRGCGIVYISHRLKEVMQITDRVVVMRDGSIEATCDTRDCAMSDLVSWIVGEAIATPPPQAPPISPAVAPLAERKDGKETPLLEVDHIRGGPLKQGVSLTLRRGEVLGIGGLVGSGRTELVRLITGADRAEAGQVRVSGRPVRIRSPHDAMLAGVVLLPEDRRRDSLFLHFNVRENISVASLRKHRHWSWIPVPSKMSERSSARAAIQRLAVKVNSEEDGVTTLSGGNQQKVIVARWLEQSPDVLIMDEPTQGIDVHAKEEVFSLIESLAAAGKGIIFISSDFSELERVCNRVVVLCEGVVAGELDQSEVTENAIVRLSYSGYRKEEQTRMAS